ncbi:MAG: hypothetical protein ACQESF_04870 [Nanobdellota archaeon]
MGVKDLAVEENAFLWPDFVVLNGIENFFKISGHALQVSGLFAGISGIRLRFAISIFETHITETYLYYKPFLAYMRQEWLNLDSDFLKLLVPFTSNYSQKKSSSDISKKMSIPKRTVSRKLKGAEELGLIKSITQGRNKFYYIDLLSAKAFYFLLFLETYKALEFFNSNPKIGFYLERVKNTKIIFGSYAKYGEGNDLDVVFFGRDKVDVSDSPVKIHQQKSTFNDFKKALTNKDSLAWEIADNHIILNEHEKFVRILLEAYNG